MFDKINPSKIIRDHFNTLRDNQSRRLSGEDILLFILAPALLSLALVWLDYTLTEALSNVLVTALSIFAALLFNLLLLIYDIINREKTSGQAGLFKKQFLGEIFANISYSILVSILTVLLLLFVFYQITQPWLLTALNLVIYYLIIQFILTLFMVLKRVHILLAKQFER